MVKIIILTKNNILCVNAYYSKENFGKILLKYNFCMSALEAIEQKIFNQ